MRPTLTNRHDLYGAVYDNNLFLRPQSLRGLGGKWRHKDPASLHNHEVADVVELDGDFQYLGHAFGGYGHFILETLPMLAYLMEGNLKMESSYRGAKDFPVSCWIQPYAW
jgi:hypothetical protein